MEASWLPPAWAEAAASLAPVWAALALGFVVGQLLPRTRLARVLPKTSRLGSAFARTLLAWHVVVILRECWHAVARPGTLRGVLRATVQWMCGRGFAFAWPASVMGGVPLAAAQSGELGGGGGGAGGEWYVTEKDLAFFEYHALQGGPLPGATPWEPMFDKDVPGFVSYKAWRRVLPDGKTEYKSVTVAPDVTPQEFMDMYLDDSFRRNWDGMVIHHEVLEHGDFASRQQVVRWIRRFPFAFLSDREYTIARRLFRHEDGSLSACTKAIEHPREYRNSAVVRMDVFHSHWRSRSVPCPWGSGKPATETVLLHHEQFKINERLARFAVSHGMWQFVRKLASTVPQYTALRRRHCAPDKEDPSAYGAGFAPNPPGARGGCAAGVDGTAGARGVSPSRGTRRADAYRPRRRRVPAAAAVVLAGGLALAVGAVRGSSSCGGGSSTGTSSSYTSCSGSEAPEEEALLPRAGGGRARPPQPPPRALGASLLRG